MYTNSNQQNPQKKNMHYGTFELLVHLRIKNGHYVDLNDMSTN